MANIETQLIVEAISRGFDKVVNDTKRVDSAIDNSSKTAGSASNKYTELVSKLGAVQMAYGAVVGVVRSAADAINKGADLQLARSQFENLTESIGVTADALMGELRTATNGMMSDAQLVEGASKIISLGLADTQEETVRLAKAVGVLGLDMSQVILTFANNSKMRLDSLGLSISDVNARTEEYTKAGMDANKAFDTAVLDALDAKMALLGDTSETTAGKIMKLEAAQENLTNRFNEFMAVQWAPIIGGLADSMDAVGESTDKGRSSLTNAAVVMNELLRTVSPTAAALNDQWIATRKVSEETVKLYQGTGALAEQYANANRPMSANVEYSDDLARSYANVNSQTRELTLSIKQVADVYSTVGDLAQRYGQANETTAAQIFEATKAENEHRIAMEQSAAMTATFVDALNNGGVAAKSLEQSMFDQAQAAGASIEVLAGLASATGLWSEEQVNAALQAAALQAYIDQQAAALASGSITIGEYTANVKNFAAEIQNLPAHKEINIHTSYTSSGTPSGDSHVGGPGSGVGSGSPQAFATGGWTGNAGGIVHPNELVVPSNIINQGMGAVAAFANQNVPGGVSGGVSSGGNNISITIHQRPGEDSTRLANKVSSMVADKIGGLN